MILREKERARERENPKQFLPVSTEPDVGSKLTNSESPEPKLRVRCLTDWASLTLHEMVTSYTKARTEYVFLNCVKIVLLILGIFFCYFYMH